MATSTFFYYYYKSFGILTPYWAPTNPDSSKKESSPQD